MHTNETRVSQALSNTEGGADSHEELNPRKVGRLELSCGGNERVAQGAMAPVEGIPAPSPLSDAQLAQFWAGVDVNRKAALRRAARFVSKHSAEDVAHSAALLFVEDAERRSMD